MAALKPFQDASVYVGKFNASILSFLPGRDCWRLLIEEGHSVNCKKHREAGERIILPGDRVVAVKWINGSRNGRPTYRVFFYCSLECQRAHQAKGNFRRVA